MKNKLIALICALLTALALLVMITFKCMSQTEGQVFFVYIFLLAAVVIASVRLIVWLRESVIEPLDKLKEAIREMEKGNLDHILDTDPVGEVGEVSEEFEKLRVQIRDNVESKVQSDRENRELISNISHDLKTPITAIKGYAEGIADGIVSGPEQLNRYVRTIISKSNDMVSLIDELTYYTKIDTNRIPYNYDKLSPVAFFDDCVEDLGLDLESRGIIFTYSKNVSQDTLIIADVEQLKRVVNNIIGNAIKYIDKRPGILNIRLLDDGDFIKVEIEDNGKGIAAKDLGYIFDRFYRTDASRNSATGGRGIGLSIARKIIEDHGGRIWANSVEGRGTRFTFIIRKYQES